MRFAYSRHHSSIETAISTWGDQSLARGLQVFALLDGSMFSPRDIQQLARASIIFRPALIGSPFENLELQGPLLWEIDGSNQKKLPILLRRTEGIPALSLIATTELPEHLCEVLLWLAIAHTQDEQKLHCRFADTRTLPSLLNCLNAEQIDRLAKAINEWLWITRDGKIETRQFTIQATPAVQKSDTFQLDASQFDFMLTAAEADMVFQMLDEKMSDLIPDSLPHEIHARIASLLNTARGYGITDLPELFQYTVVALSTRDDFDQHPAVRDTWTRLKSETLSFSALAEQWPETFWLALTPPDEDAVTFDPE